MNILALITFLFSIETLLGVFFPEFISVKIIFYSLSLLISSLPVLYSTYEFFTSPKSKLKRLKLSIYKLIFTDNIDSYLSMLSINGTPLFCNEIENKSCSCSHRRHFVFCGQDISKSVDPGDIKNRVSVNFKKEISRDSYSYLMGMGLKESQIHKNTFEYFDTKDIPTIIMNTLEEKFFICSIEIKKVRLVFNYDYCSSLVNVVRFSENYSKGRSSLVHGVKMSDFVYTLKFLNLVKETGRTCCFIIDESKTRNVMGGLRMHSVGIEKSIIGLLKGQKIKYGDYTDSDKEKCVEGEDNLHLAAMEMKFGSLFSVLDSFIKNVYKGEIFWLREFLVRSESARRPKMCPLSNWQWKRFCVDMSYLRERHGFCPMYGIDRSIHPSFKVKKFISSKKVNLLGEPTIIHFKSKIIGLSKEGILNVAKPTSLETKEWVLPRKEEFKLREKISEKACLFKTKEERERELPLKSKEYNYYETLSKDVKKNRSYCDVVSSYKSVNTVKKGECKEKWAKYNHTGDLSYLKREEESFPKMHIQDKINFKEKGINRINKFFKKREEQKDLKKVGNLKEFKKSIGRVSYKIGKVLYSTISDKDYYMLTQGDLISAYGFYKNKQGDKRAASHGKKTERSKNERKKQFSITGNMEAVCKKIGPLLGKIRASSLKKDRDMEKKKERKEKENEFLNGGYKTVINSAIDNVFNIKKYLDDKLAEKQKDLDKNLENLFKCCYNKACFLEAGLGKNPKDCRVENNNKKWGKRKKVEGRKKQKQAGNNRSYTPWRWEPNPENLRDLDIYGILSE